MNDHRYQEGYKDRELRNTTLSPGREASAACGDKIGLQGLSVNSHFKVNGIILGNNTDNTANYRIHQAQNDPPTIFLTFLSSPHPTPHMYSTHSRLSLLSVFLFSPFLFVVYFSSSFPLILCYCVRSRYIKLSMWKYSDAMRTVYMWTVLNRQTSIKVWQASYLFFAVFNQVLPQDIITHVD